MERRLQIDHSGPFLASPLFENTIFRLSSGTIADSDEVRPNVFLDTDANGRVLGIEMLGVSKLTDKPNELALEMLTT